MWAFLLSWLLPFCLAATPDTIVRVEGLGDDLEWLARRGFFGSDKESVTGLLVHSPDDNEYMCNDTVGEIFAQDSSDIILLVPRGQCTYELKAYHAQELFGAKGILIYDHLAGRYGWNETTQRVRFPYYDRYNRDYECELGFGVAKNLDLDPPAYNGTVLDPLLDMTSFTTVCELNVTHTPCESQLCLVTSHKLNSTEYPVCCAWDLPQTMGGDDTVDAENIVAVFFTIRQGQEVLPYVGQVVTIQERPYSVFNISLVFMWLLGVLVTGIGSCWLPTEEYREFRARLAEFQQKRGQQQTKSAEDATSDDELSDDVLDRLAITLDDLEAESEEEEAEEDEDVEPQSKTKDKQNKLSPPPRNNQRKNDRNSHSLNSLPRFSQTQNDKDIVFSLNFTRTKTQNDNAWVLHSLPPPERKRGNSKTAGVPELSQVDHIPAASTSAPTTELTHWHVLSFVLISSLLLVLLFKFQFYSLVAVFYGFCCSGCVSYLIFGPILTRIIPKFGGDEVTKEFNKHIMCSCNGFDVTSQLIGLIWAILWIWYGLSHYQPSGNAFFWISLDIFGACFSLMGLYMMKLNDIRIATYLMVAIFFYDIFFVFITPLFTETGDSVMLTVAKGGASQESTDDFCVRYPDDRDCTGIDFLPMLLLIPRVNDIYQGNVLLGLGDIVCESCWNGVKFC